MKYSIEGFSQEQLLKNGLDPIDAVILRWFIDFYASGSMTMVVRSDGVPFGWVKYNRVIEEVPCTGVSTINGMSKRFKKLVDCGVLDHHHHLVGGSFSTFKPSPKVASLSSSTPLDQKQDPSGPKARPPMDEKQEQKTLLSKDPSIKDKEVRHKHGEYKHVLLTSSELERFKSDFPLDWEQRIKACDEYCQQYGKKYADYNLTMRKWAAKDKAQNSTPLFNTDPNDADRFHDPLKDKIKLRGAT